MVLTLCSFGEASQERLNLSTERRDLFTGDGPDLFEVHHVVCVHDDIADSCPASPVHLWVRLSESGAQSLDSFSYGGQLQLRRRVGPCVLTERFKGAFGDELRDQCAGEFDIAEGRPIVMQRHKWCAPN